MSFNLTILKESESQLVMTKQDSYLEHVTPFYRKIFDTDSQAEFIKQLKHSCIPNDYLYDFHYEMTQESNLWMNKAFDILGIEAPLPMSMLFTDGSDNNGWPYTKQTSLIFPINFHSPEHGVLSYFNPELVAHEYWHILSRHYPELRKAAYSAIGFKGSEQGHLDVNQPPIVDFYYINPDAMSHDFYFPLTHEGDSFKLFPLFYGNCSPSGIICDMDQNLIKIIPLSDPSLSSYRNHYQDVGYITHPEEICAEYFRILLAKSIDPKKPIKDMTMFNNFKSVIINYFN